MFFLKKPSLVHIKYRLDFGFDKRRGPSPAINDNVNDEQAVYIVIVAVYQPQL